MKQVYLFLVAILVILANASAVDYRCSGKFSDQGNDPHIAQSRGEYTVNLSPDENQGTIISNIRHGYIPDLNSGLFKIKPTQLFLGVETTIDRVLACTSESFFNFFPVESARISRNGVKCNNFVSYNVTAVLQRSNDPSVLNLSVRGDYDKPDEIIEPDQSTLSQDLTCYEVTRPNR